MTVGDAKKQACREALSTIGLGKEITVNGEKYACRVIREASTSSAQEEGFCAFMIECREV